MILAGDIGGTKTNIALFDDTRTESDRHGPAMVARATFGSDDYPHLAPIIEALAKQVGGDALTGLRAACFGVAGPVIDGRCETSNLPWVIDASALAAQFGIPRVELINDLVATAEGIPALRTDEVSSLQPGRADAFGPPRVGALIAAGTGLGLALLIPGPDGEWRAWPSEGGHADFSPRNAEETELLAFMLRRHPDHVSVERVVSGPALIPLYEHVLERDSADADLVERPEVRAAIDDNPDDAPRIISELGAANECALCARALRLFVRLYGAAAGNLALIALARGGVYVGGGVAPKILDVLREGEFIEAFRAKGRFTSLVTDMAVHVIENADAALLGAARKAQRLARER